MHWNWTQPDWPEFTWEPSRLAAAERLFLLEAGMVVGAFLHLPGEDQDRMTVEAMSTDAVTTSRIEGEVLDRQSVQSSIHRQLGLTSDHRRVRPAERGISELMVDLYRHYDQPLSDDTLFAWHGMIVPGRTDLRDIGRYRRHPEPMQIVSGRVDKPTVHFEALPSARVEAEMARYIGWFNRTARGGENPLPALTRAGIAHLYFESIHPFEDGNGRIGRAIAEMALAQSLGRPSLTALAGTILDYRREYYLALEHAQKSNHVTEWLAWFAGVAIEAQRRAAATVEFVIDKARLLDRFRDRLNQRQTTVLLRVLREGPEGFTGGLSARNYMTIAGTSSATATRDLADMVEKGALVRTGERKSTRYHPPIPLRPVARISIGPGGEIEETPSRP
jgi:Fic family protein